MDEVLKDKRFAHIAKDPRYQRIPRSQRKVKIDKRFKSMFKDKRFKLKYSVDKRGRPVDLTSNENLKKYYELSDGENSSDSDEEEAERNKTDSDGDENLGQKAKPTTETIGSREEEGEQEQDISDSEEEIVTLKKQSKKAKNKQVQIKELKKKGKTKRQEAEEESESDESLNKDDSGVDFARGEGNLESSSSDDDDDDEGDIDNGSVVKGEFDHKWGEIDQDVARVSDATPRLAMCNMDWDRVSAKDIFVLLHSFKPASGVIHSVKIYPSEFGKARMADENAYGPKELRETKLDSDEEEETVEDREGTSYHTEKLRQYQLNRLKYYYAVVECDSVETANTIYEECDGMEYETSATKLDLRFIPDDMEFDDDAKSECTELPTEYAPNLFTNTALSQSKVDLTWDETDRTRVQVTSQQFVSKKSKNKDVDDADLQAYLASSSDEEGVDYGALVEASDGESESEDEEKQIEKYKQLLQDIDKTEDSKKKKDVQMEITWEPGLREATEGILKKKQTKSLSPWEEYLQKKKEKKEKKREERKKKLENAGRQSEQSSDLDDDGQDFGETDEMQAFSDDELPDGFDQSDPFFVRENDDAVKKKVKERKKKKKGATVNGTEDQEKAELSLLMMDEKPDSRKHFSLDKLIEDSSGKKTKKKKKMDKEKKKKEEDEFEMQLDDPRFSAIYSSHLYNIDPSAPEYKKTKGTDALIQEKLKRSSDVSGKKHKLSDKGDNFKHKKRKNESQELSKLNEETLVFKPSDGKPGDDSLDSLIKSVKAKTKQFHNKKVR